MKGKVVTIFGGAGFLGPYLVEKLAQQGAVIRVAVRNPDRAKFLRPLGYVGQITPHQVDVTAPKSIESVLKGSDVVVNMIGILYPSGTNTFENAHVKASRTIAQLATQHRVERLVQVSAIGADAGSESVYASTKGKAEKAVLEFFPDATIMRPSILFGPEDDFFNRFASMSTFSPVLPLVGGGTTRFQPVYVGDVAQACWNAIGESKQGKNPHAGKIYELGGPSVYTFKQILEFILEHTGRSRKLITLPYKMASFAGYFLQLLPRPLLTPDQVTLLKVDNVVADKALTLKDLKIEPNSIESIVPNYLRRYRYAG